MTIDFIANQMRIDAALLEKDGTRRKDAFVLGAAQSRLTAAHEIESWARETSGDWNKVIELSEQNDSFSEEFKGGLFQGISSCLEDLGVPEE